MSVQSSLSDKSFSINNFMFEVLIMVFLSWWVSLAVISRISHGIIWWDYSSNMILIGVIGVLMVISVMTGRIKLTVCGQGILIMWDILKCWKILKELVDQHREFHWWMVKNDFWEEFYSDFKVCRFLVFKISLTSKYKYR